jgi:hypothetical protein
MFSFVVLSSFNSSVIGSVVIGSVDIGSVDIVSAVPSKVGYFCELHLLFYFI